MNQSRRQGGVLWAVQSAIAGASFDWSMKSGRFILRRFAAPLLGFSLLAAPELCYASAAPPGTPPTISALASSVTFGENTVNAGYQVIDSAVAVTDPDTSFFNEGTLDISYSSGGGSQDYLRLNSEGNSSGQIGVSGTTVKYSNVTVGTITSNGDAGASLTISLNGSASPTAVERMIEVLAYKNTSDNPASVRTIQVTVDDGVDGSSDPQTTDINVTAENDAPTDIASSASSIAENSSSGSTVGTLSSTDPDTGNTFTYSLVSGTGSTDKAKNAKEARFYRERLQLYPLGFIWTLTRSCKTGLFRRLAGGIQQAEAGPFE